MDRRMAEQLMAAMKAALDDDDGEEQGKSLHDRCRDLVEARKRLDEERNFEVGDFVRAKPGFGFYRHPKAPAYVVKIEPRESVEHDDYHGHQGNRSNVLVLVVLHDGVCWAKVDERCVELYPEANAMRDQWAAETAGKADFQMDFDPER